MNYLLTRWGVISLTLSWKVRNKLLEGGREGDEGSYISVLICFSLNILYYYKKPKCPRENANFDL